MYARVTFGSYRSKSDADEAMALMRDSLLPRHRNAAGVRDLYALRTGDTQSLVVAIYESQDAAERANGLRGESIERMKRYQTEHPRIIEGASLIHGFAAAGEVLPERRGTQHAGYVRVTMGTFKSKADADEALALMKESLLPKHRSAPGVRDVYVLRTGETSSLVVAIYESQDAAERANGLRGESIERMKRYQTEHPRIVEGASILHGFPPPAEGVSDRRGAQQAGYVRVTLGSYKSRADADEAMSVLKEQLLPRHRSAPGVRDMYALRTGETSSVVVAIYESQEAAERANGLRGDSIERMKRYQTEHPRIIEGASLM